MNAENVLNPTSSAAGRPLRLGLWIAQGALAALFVASAVSKLTLPVSQLAAQVPWTADLPLAFVRFTGLVDLAGGLGILLPALTRIAPRLTVWAAVGLTVLQSFAMIFHFSRGEFAMLPINLVLLTVAIFVAWGRSQKVLIRARSKA
ncbi:DoxX family protein [Paraburkholderia sp. BCC1884]|uniref:DoxX family protein n=1 Tax=Paraburkholderia sp. BCC1884 TaxID=2562668 RepID=UPI001182E7C6|nr:DoxX family protein [Paraburkholderia sp. BCC1884]